ncbi:MAG: MCP four helix bundle domain-containing protein, partial [Desulfamplus sp.]|nr:MCP four helix bundle domain-containing protein [Desulfamplus sp.]
MKFKDLKIATQLKMGLSLILVLMMLLGTLSLIQTGQLWEETKGLYEHPLTVRRAVGEIKADIIYIHRDMKDLFLTDNEQGRQLLLQDIDTWEADAYRQFDILFDRYLGPKNDIEEAYNAFIQWRSIREETIRLLRIGETKEAINRTKSSGVGGGHVANLLGKVKKISDFAIARGDKFYKDASKQHDHLKIQLTFVIVAILFITAGIAYFLLMRIREPLNDLTSATNRFYKGDLDARSNYISSNEFGILSASFNEMADTIVLRLETEKKSSAIAETLIIANDIKEFAETVLEKLMEITESNMGAFYIRNTDKINFSPIASIGVNPELLETFNGQIFEGGFGQSLKTGKISHIRNIPEDTIFKFKTFLGTAIPKEIITLPILVNEDVLAMVSLASLNGYSHVSLTILSQPSLIALNTAFGNLIANDKTRLLAEELKQTNEELESQKEELWEQTMELKAQSEEVIKQSEELQEQNIQLEQQRLAVEDANRLKSQFLSNMSHELRTPLNSVMALSRVLMMQAKQKLNDDEVSYLEIIERNGKNLLNLINDILDLSKIESGRMDITPNFFSIGETIENIVERLTPIAEEKSIKIDFNISANL